MFLWATIVSLLATVGVQAQERVVDLTPKGESGGGAKASLDISKMNRKRRGQPA